MIFRRDEGGIIDAEGKGRTVLFCAGKSCAEAILLAANEAYHLGMTEEVTKLFAGFRTGMGRAAPVVRFPVPSVS